MPEMLSPRGSGDCYKVPIILKKEFKNKIELLTLPLNPGVTIIRKLI